MNLIKANAAGLFVSSSCSASCLRVCEEDGAGRGGGGGYNIPESNPPERVNTTAVCISNK